VLETGRGHDAQATEALQTLCQTYWYPLYAFLRRFGYTPEDAEDLTQGFFARLLEKDYLSEVAPRKGRFRSFLLAAIKHFIADERDKAHAQKRGGGKPLVSLDARAADARYDLEDTHDLPPDKLFERRWALSLLAVVFERLAKDYAEAGKDELFQVLQSFLAPDAEMTDYVSAAHRLHMNESAVRMAVSRLRRRYANLFREEVAQTVADPGEIEDEMRWLRRILSD
jgi:RNA polymerase sigma-70 factor (ECF subfamily)